MSFLLSDPALCAGAPFPMGACHVRVIRGRDLPREHQGPQLSNSGLWTGGPSGAAGWGFLFRVHSSLAAILLELWGAGTKTQACLPPTPQHLARYVEQYVGTEGASSSPTEGFLLKPVFLQR